MRTLDCCETSVGLVASMPSIEETCVLSPSNATTTPDFLARDMEEIVSEMKENLRLSGYKSKQSQRTSRPSPYQIPSRWRDSGCKSCVLSSDVKCPVHSCFNKSPKSAETDDPYELLQELIRNGSLIKEAVRRLQKGLWPKQRYLYESDEEPTRSPMKLCKQ